MYPYVTSQFAITTTNTKISDNLFRIGPCPIYTLCASLLGSAHTGVLVLLVSFSPILACFICAA